MRMPALPPGKPATSSLSWRSRMPDTTSATTKSGGDRKNNRDCLPDWLWGYDPREIHTPGVESILPKAVDEEVSLVHASWSLARSQPYLVALRKFRPCFRSISTHSDIFSDHDDEVREVLRERPLMRELPYVFLDGLWLKRLIAGPADIARQISIRGQY